MARGTGRAAFNEQSFYNVAFFRHDKIYRELAQVALNKNSNYQLSFNADLRDASPHAPICVSSQIMALESMNKFDRLVAEAPEWEKKYADSPVVMAALAQMYLRLERDDDALRVAKREFELAPDVNSCIRLGRALEKYNIAWLEDMVPWYYTDLLKEIKQAVKNWRADEYRV